ncbi:MAG: hypothetical protein Q9186_001782 [Xanthomendoza sp. 1 TL-2023]
MALVHESIGDFVLFPRDQAYCDPSSTTFGEGFVGLDFEHGSTLAMQQPYPSSGLGPFDSSSSVPAFSSAQSLYYSAPDFVQDPSKARTRSYQQRHTPSGSASPSIPQSLEHPPSTLSSASRASGQSTASSAAGSPYSLPTHSLPGQDPWGESNQGLGIGHGMLPNDGFAQDAFPTGGLENELYFHDGKFPDSFVGECGRFSSFPSSQTFSSSQDFPIPRCVSPLPSFTYLPRDTAGIVVPGDSSGGSHHLRRPIADGNDDEKLESRSIAANASSPGKQLFKQPQKPASGTLPAPHEPTHFRRHAALQTQKLPIHSPNFLSSQSNGSFIAPLASSWMVHAFPLPSQTFQPPSPSPSDASSYDSHRSGSARFRSGTASPYLHSSSFQPYPRGSEARRLSIASSLSRVSQENTRSTSLSLDEDGKERGRCPNPDCGRLFKDLKAHMLTHQSERPEKCPIVTCEYHQKGFARKYDKNRHTLTHYKGTMVCGFCPGSGSAAEKSFNRADVFKRHLTSLHGVEQTPPNSRKKSPTASAAKKSSDFSGDAAGKCSTCSAMFSNAQEFYEHLDDCVLRVVQQEEPSEAINEQHLTEVAHDQSVLETLDRNLVQGANPRPFNAEEDDEGSESGEYKDEASSDQWPPATRNNPRSGKGQIKTSRGDSS